jgi:hypothetical protein
VNRQATAFAVRPDGTLLTVFHAVSGAQTVTVTCHSGSPTTGTVETISATNDLAVIRIGRPTPDYLPLAEARSVQVGEPVFTVGFPVTDILGRDPKFTDGSISALSGLGGESSLMQVTVPVQPGNSGGPLLNHRGEVVGIITSSAAVARFLQESGTLPQNVNWAVKVEYAAPLFERPTVKPQAVDRADAINQALKAICLIQAPTLSQQATRGTQLRETLSRLTTSLSASYRIQSRPDACRLMLEEFSGLPRYVIPLDSLDASRIDVYSRQPHPRVQVRTKNDAPLIGRIWNGGQALDRDMGLKFATDTEADQAKSDLQAAIHLCTNSR